MTTSIVRSTVCRVSLSFHGCPAAAVQRLEEAGLLTPEAMLAATQERIDELIYPVSEKRKQ